MAAKASSDHPSPWRRIFEEVRREVGAQRDSNGVIGSINWLRKQMEAHGANPNVVRNIIYRDKGKLSDKRVLFEILNGLWESTGNPPLKIPELEVLLAPGSSTEQEILQLLGREKRRAYRAFVGGVRGGEHPKFLLTGRPGSGKTLLIDYIQQALEMAPKAAERIVRLDFNSNDLATAISRLGRALEVPDELMASKLVKIGTSGAFAVQADAQADVARVILEAGRHLDNSIVLLLHVSQSMGGQDNLGLAPLRLNTSEVPRVSASEWLWLSLFEPLSHLPGISILVSMTDVPARALQALGNFEGPFRLNPPTANEARRFVRARLPHLSPNQQEILVQRAGRSFEELRTLTLLAEIREPLQPQGSAAETSSKHIERLSHLIQTSGDQRLRDFLAALAILSIPEFPTFHQEALFHLRAEAWREPTSLELAFLDPVPGRDNYYRCFSRQLARTIRQHLYSQFPEVYTELNDRASSFYHPAALRNPKGEEAARYLHHLFEAREWSALEAWMQRHPIQQSLVRRTWHAAERELSPDETFEGIAYQVAAYYVKLGSYDHPDAVNAFRVLASSSQQEMRAWTTLKQAEGAVLKGNYDQAESILQDWNDPQDPLLNAEVALVRASIARWRGQLNEAARLVSQEARCHLPQISTSEASGRLVHAKVAVWAGLIRKDRGDLEGSLAEFDTIRTNDDLITARIAFQKGDVLLKLGCFDAALKQLNQAVKLSHRSEALVPEQMRYLSRRGTLYRQRGDLGNAAADFRAARAILRETDPSTPHIERDFWLAKVDEERALNLLALGEFDAAIFVFKKNRDIFGKYEEAFVVDASYRILRSTLYLAIAYACRGLARPYRPPFTRQLDEVVSPRDITHAQELIGEVLAAITTHPNEDRYGPLRRQAYLTASLFGTDPEIAERHARQALKGTRFPNQKAEGQAHLAAAKLHQQDPHATIELVQQAITVLQHTWRRGQERGNLGLLTWLHSLEILAYSAIGDVTAAGDALVSCLQSPWLDSYHEVLLRLYGEAVEGQPELPWLEHPGIRDLLELPHMPLAAKLVRLPDALAVRWHELRPTQPIAP